MAVRVWRVARNLAIALAAALLIATALVYAVLQGLGRDALTQRAESELTLQLGIPVSIDAIDGSLLPRFALRGIRLGDPDRPIASADALAVDLEPSSLWDDGPLTVRSLRIDGLQTHVDRTADGDWQIPLALSAGDDDGETASGIPDIWIQNLELRRSRVDLSWTPHDLVWIDFDAQQLRVPLSREAVAALEGNLNVRFEGAADSDLPIARADVTVTLRAGRVEISRGDAEGAAGRFEIRGHTQLADWLDTSETAEAEIELRFSNLDIGKLAERPELDSALEGTARLTARAAAGDPRTEPAFELETRAANRAATDSADVAALAVQSVDLSARLSGQRWELLRCEIHGSAAELSADGSGDGDTIDHLRAVARIPDLAPFAQLLDWTDTAGAIDVDLTVTGSIERPEGHVRVNGERLRIRGVELGSLQTELRGTGDGRIEWTALELSGGVVPLRLTEPGTATLRDGALEIDGLAFASGTQHVAIDGTLGPDSVRALRIEASGVEVERIAALFELPQRVSGAIDAEVVLNGALTRPDASGRFEWSQPGFETFSSERIRGNFSTLGDRLELSVELREAGRDIVTASATLSISTLERDPTDWLGSPDTALKIRSEPIDLARFDALIPASRVQLTGNAMLELDLAGGSVPSARGRFDWTDGGAFVAELDRTFAPIEGELEFAPHAAGIAITAFEFTNGQQRVTGEGVVGDAELHDVRVRAHDLDVALIATLVPQAANWSGRADLDVSVDGPFEQPKVHAQLAWREPQIAGVTLEAVNAELDFDAGRARMQLDARESGREVLRIDAAGIPPRSGEGFDDWLAAPESRIDVRGDQLELGLLEPFLSRRVRDLRGRVDLRAEIRGGTPPALNGSIDLAGGTIRVPILRQTFAPIEGRLLLTGDAIEIEALRVGSQAAGASVRGTIAVAGGLPGAMDLHVSLHELPVARSSVLHTDVAGEISVTGPLDAISITGDVELHELRANLSEGDDAALREIRVIASDTDSRGPIRETQPEAGAFDRAEIDLGVRVPRNSWLRGRGAELDLRGNVRLRKERLQPAVLIGRAEVVRGTYRFQTKRFEVRTGTATFEGGNAMDPLLHVEAAHPVGDVTVLIFIDGRLSAPQLRIDSEPAMSESDALSYLFLGRPASQLGSDKRAGMEAAATALASGAAAAQVSALLTATLPIDSFDAQLDETGKPAEIRIGKYVTDRVFVRYGRSFGIEPKDEVRVEFEINQNWSIGTDAATDQSAGADVIWSLDY